MWKKTVAALYLVILGAMDIKEKKVPVWLLVLGMLGAVAVSLSEGFGDGTNWQGNLGGMLVEKLIGMLPGFFLLIMAYLTGKAGYGDGIVLLLSGILHGYRFTMALLCGSLLLVFLVCVLLLLFRKVGRDTRIPYLPFLAAAYTAWVFWEKGW